MALIEFPQRQAIPSYCSCSAPSPAYTPKMSSLSDTDLDVLELLGFAGYSGQLEIPLTCDFVQQVLVAERDCWTCLTPRKRKELIVSAFGVPDDADQVRRALRLLERCMTPNQIAAILDFALYNFILDCTAP